MSVDLGERRRVAVIGCGTSGRGAMEALVARGHDVTGWDQKDGAEGIDGARLMVVADPDQMALEVIDSAPDLVVVSPGIPPHNPVFQAVQRAGIDLWGEVELAWRLQEDGPHAGRPWLAVTGTNGKTTTVGMLGAILRANGENALEVGNIGTPITRAIDSDATVFAVELSSFQLKTTYSMSPEAAACLNVDVDHLDWHGTVDDYRDSKARIYSNTQVACVYPAHDPVVEKMVEDADVVEGARAIGTTGGVPAVSQVGIVETSLVDRAFLDTRHREALHLATFEDLAHLGPAGLSQGILSDALTAAALARAHGVDPDAVAKGLRSFHPAGHRRAVVAHAADLTWIDDSKATNAHAALASLQGLAPRTAVWIAGGDAKGQSFDDLVTKIEPLLRGVVLIGADRAPLREALKAHAPQVPVVEVEAHDDWMFSVVNEAVALSRPGDTVVLAPATASWDQFDNYGQRGDVFAEAVHRLATAWEEQA